MLFLSTKKLRAADMQYNSLIIKTPIGAMLATGNKTHIYSLTFIQNFQKQDNPSPALEFLKQELELYFENKLILFKSKLAPDGTNFQRTVWNSLQKIPYGQTTSYQDIAKNISHPKSYRAVANANGKNKILILIPCHRIIRKNGDLSGFTAGIEKKEWLLNHEKQSFDSK